MNPNIKNGDWICNCGYHNFATNLTCLKCRVYKGTGTTLNIMNPPVISTVLTPPMSTFFTPSQNVKKGDWICRHCTFHNFAKNFKCKKCGVWH
jgi:hypothetical protein